jgi:predicted ABC-type ATPase
MFAGPNGSGKSTLIAQFVQARSFNLGYVLNADEVEKEFAGRGRIDFGRWGLTLDEAALRDFLHIHPLAKHWSDDQVAVQSGEVSIGGELLGGYFSAVLCDFVRRQWVRAGTTFTFETVMSSGDKVDLLAEAKADGYRTYLYFVCTGGPMINRDRVSARVAEGGHDVPIDKIAARYLRSLGLLRGAIGNANRAYLFDNSGTPSHRFVAEYENGSLVMIVQDPPRWVKDWAPLGR